MRTNDDLALQQFIGKVKDKLIAHIISLVDKSRAEDIFQEALYKIFLLAEQNPSQDSLFNKLDRLTPMLFVIAKNKALSDVRHARVEEKYRCDKKQANLTSIAKSAESTVIHDHEAKQLLDAINQLPPICRQVFIQRKLNGKSHAQIASMLNISTKTVETHIARGLKQCRELLCNQHIKASPERHKKKKLA